MASGRHLRQALTEVFREQRSALWGFLAKGAGNREMAEELLQEVFLRLWGHQEKIATVVSADDREGLRRYIWRVARNLMIDEIRSRQRRREQEMEHRHEAQASEAVRRQPDAAATVEHEECLRVVRQTVRRLPAGKMRRCVELWVEGKNLVEIAEQMNLGVGQVRGLLQRGRAEVIRRAAGRFRLAPAPPPVTMQLEGNQG